MMESPRDRTEAEDDDEDDDADVLDAVTVTDALDDETEEELLACGRTWISRFLSIVVPQKFVIDALSEYEPTVPYE